MRTLTIDEYLLEALNRYAQARGEEVQIVLQRPTPKVAARDGVMVIPMKRPENGDA